MNSPSTASIGVAIVGASGYSGRELIRILSRHPRVRLTRLTAHTTAGKHIAEVHPVLAGHVDAVLDPYEPAIAGECDLVILALPSGEAMHLVPDLLAAGRRVIDLGGDFRLRDAATYKRYYKHTHVSPDLLPHSVYGLTELSREAVRTAHLVANPGCYPTGILLPLIPLLRAGIIADGGISIVSLSGVSGAGRTSAPELSFAEVNESARAYKVGTHQHLPEIEQALAEAVGRSVPCIFVPHLIPVTRGILTTITTKLLRPCGEEEILSVFSRMYDHAPFVRVSAERVPELAHVVHTNSIDIGFRIDPDRGKLILLSAIDNLLKGAAGQAVQNLNLMYGFPETEGLR